jgi:hypothetical protein
MTLDAAGNLGVGVTNPSSYGKLAVDGNISMASHTQTLFANKIAIVSSSGNMELLGGSANIVFKTGASNDERARIDSDGNFRIGLTTAAYNTERLTVFKSGDVEAGAFVNNAGANNYTLAVSNRGTTGDNKFVVFATESTDTTRGSITYNRVGGLTVYNTTSDYRAKDIYGSIVNSGEVIDSVPVYMGKMKDATQERPMFIAHETPEYAHTGEKDAVDADGNIKPQGIDTSFLVATLTAALQEQQAIIESLKARLDAANL